MPPIRYSHGFRGRKPNTWIATVTPDTLKVDEVIFLVEVDENGKAGELQRDSLIE